MIQQLRSIARRIAKRPPASSDGGQSVFGESAHRAAESDEPASDVEVAMWHYLLYIMLPLWIVPGVLDWWWHRETKIEQNAGTFESLIHSVEMSLVAVPVLSLLLLEVNALVLVMMTAAFVLHEGVSYWDVRYARSLRDVPAKEQHTHSFLEVLPFMAASMACCLQWKQFLAVFGKGDEPARWNVELKRRPLSARYVVAILGGVTAFVGVPYAEEFMRCYRVDRTLAPHEPEEN